MQTLALEKTPARDFALVMLASFAICLSGQIAILLWVTPIPLATQNGMVLLMSAFLGARRGAAATFAFLLQGALGLPVFSNGGGGFSYFFTPKGGYLIGYLLASYAVGALIEKKKSPLGAFAAGHGIIYLCGASYLSLFVGGFGQAFLLGIAPFLLGDLFKTLASLKILQWINGRRHAANKGGSNPFHTDP